MALTKERKILIAVAGVACGIFLLDRAMLGGTMGGPAEAHAAGPAVVAPAPAADVATAVSAPATAFVLAEPDAPTTSLAQRLEHAGRHLTGDTPDAFRPSARWNNEAPVEQPVVNESNFDPKAFARTHRLDAVYASPQGAYAMVAGEAVRRGDVRDGMTLTEIGDRWVVWTGGGVRVRVHLDPAR